MSDPSHYAIQSTVNASEWWSNEFGWVEKPSRDIFTAQERVMLDLPIEGQWVEADPDEVVTPHDEEFPDEHDHDPEFELGEEGTRTGVYAVDDESRHYWLEVKTTHEGIIIDVFDRYGDENLATFTRSFDELVDFVFATDPLGGP